MRDRSGRSGRRRGSQKPGTACGAASWVFSLSAALDAGAPCALATAVDIPSATPPRTGTASQLDKWRPGASDLARGKLDDGTGSGLRDFGSDGLIDQFCGNSS